MYISSHHPGVVGCYFKFSITVGKDVYGQSGDKSCLDMLQGCVEHEVCREGLMEESFCVFWKAHDAYSSGALRWAEGDGCAGKPQVNGYGDTSGKVVGVRAAGCAVVAHLRTGEQSDTGGRKFRGLNSTGCTYY